MRKSKLLLVVGALALASAAFATPAPVTATATASVVGFATAAPWGTWQAELAPAYTRLAALRHRAARALEARRIPVAVAIEIQAKADVARARLDASRRGEVVDPTPIQRQALAEAIRQIEQAEQLLER